MLPQLPDVNVLLALHDPSHQGHELAHRWFRDEGRLAWATCPLTENGFIRILCQPSYPNSVRRPVAARRHLEETIRAHRAGHQFWPGDVSLRDATLFSIEHLTGHRQLTDTYLLGLCHKNDGVLVTLDAAIAARVVVGCPPTRIRILRL
jgi:hypothetical protein